MLGLSQMCSGMLTIAKHLRQKLYRKPIDFLVNSLSRCNVGFVFNNFRCIVNRKLCIEDIMIGNVLRLVQFRELRIACDCTGANVWVSQRLKSLRGILVRNCGFSESDFFVVCEDIWIAICPFFVVVHHYYVNLSILFTQKSLKMISYQQHFSPFLLLLAFSLRIYLTNFIYSFTRLSWVPLFSSLCMVIFMHSYVTFHSLHLIKHSLSFECMKKVASSPV